MRVKFVDTTAAPSDAMNCIEMELDFVPRVGESVMIDFQISQKDWFSVSARKVGSVSWFLSRGDSAACVYLVDF